MEATPPSLLERLRRPGEQAAWERFVRIYTPLLLSWARRLNVREADAADLVQDVFVILVRRLPEFEYDPAQRFRGWLWTVFINKWRERRRKPVPITAATEPSMEDLSAPDHLAAMIEAEYRDYLVQRVLGLLQSEFQPGTWRAFWESVATRRTAAEIAQDLGITENAVYLAKSRVLRRLRAELNGLLD